MNKSSSTGGGGVNTTDTHKLKTNKRNPERKGNRDRKDEDEKMPSRGGRR
jgi:hypothetical protein